MAKVAIITGADGGMGQEHTRSVAMAGYEVIMACRNTQKAERLSQQIASETGGNIHVYHLDLASFSSIYNFTDQIKQNYTEVHLLLNNAGTLLHQAEQTENGIERTVGVNYLGHYLLTRLLLPLFHEESRIVSMVSLTIRYGKIDHDNFTTAYSDSKLALLYFTLDLAEELKKKQIYVNCADPGIVSTDIIRQGNPVVDKLCDWFFRPIIYKPAKGASTMLHVALSPGVDVTGQCFARKKPIRLRDRIINNPHRKELHDRTEEIIREISAQIGKVWPEQISTDKFNSQ